MKKFIRNILKVFVSREFAFIYCVIGTVGQVAHTYYLTENISSYTGNGKVLQAIILSAFISTSLLYFTSISDNKRTRESENVKLAVILFMVIEILVNLYYYSRHLLITKGGWDNITTENWFDFGFGVLISCLIPVTIKLYATHIRAKEWLEIEDAETTSENIAKNAESLKLEIISDIKNELNLESIDEKIKESFERNSELFLTQFNNKVKTHLNNNQQ